MNRVLRLSVAVGVVLALAGAAHATVMTETFPDPLGGFYGRWLGANSNMGSFYLSAGDPNADARGNNPEGLWVSGNQTVGGGVSGSVLTIVFNPTFGSTLASFSFGVEAFVQQRISIFDIGGGLLSTGVFSGGDFGFDHADTISALSSNGIGSITFDSTAFGSGQVSGNTSVDNFTAETIGEPVPEPTTLALLGTGVLGALIRRKRAS